MGSRISLFLAGVERCRDNRREEMVEQIDGLITATLSTCTHSINTVIEVYVSVMILTDLK
jgi:hypothetical protein